MNQKHKNNNELEKGLNFESLKEKKILVQNESVLVREMK